MLKFLLYQNVKFLLSEYVVVALIHRNGNVLYSLFYAVRLRFKVACRQTAFKVFMLYILAIHLFLLNLVRLFSPEPFSLTVCATTLA